MTTEPSPQLNKSKGFPPLYCAQNVERRKYDIVPVSEIPACYLDAFNEKMFSERAGFLNANWRWLYRIGQYGWASSPLAAVSDGMMVGFIGNIPVVLQKGVEKYKAAWLVDMAILPEWQRLGIGMALIRASMERYPLLLGFGNEGSVGAVLKCGWESNFNTHSLQLLLHPESHPRFQQSGKNKLIKAAGMATRVVWQARTFLHQQITVEPATQKNLREFARHDCGYLLHVARSESFLNWRILNNPLDGQQMVLRQSQGRHSQCGAIARISEEKGYKRLHLLSLALPNNKRAINDFLASVIQWSVKADIDRILMVSNNPALIGIARWWLPVITKLSFIYHATDQNGWELLRSSEQLWECLDNDFDLT